MKLKSVPLLQYLILMIMSSNSPAFPIYFQTGIYDGYLNYNFNRLTPTTERRKPINFNNNRSLIKVKTRDTMSGIKPLLKKEVLLGIHPNLLSLAINEVKKLISSDVGVEPAIQNNSTATEKENSHFLKTPNKYLRRYYVTSKKTPIQNSLTLKKKIFLPLVESFESYRSVSGESNDYSNEDSLNVNAAYESDSCRSMSSESKDSSNEANYGSLTVNSAYESDSNFNNVLWISRKKLNKTNIALKSNFTVSSNVYKKQSPLSTTSLLVNKIEPNHTLIFPEESTPFYDYNDNTKNSLEMYPLKPQNILSDSMRQNQDRDNNRMYGYNRIKKRNNVYEFYELYNPFKSKEKSNEVIYNSKTAITISESSHYLNNVVSEATKPKHSTEKITLSSRASSSPTKTNEREYLSSRTSSTKARKVYSSTATNAFSTRMIEGSSASASSSQPPQTQFLQFGNKTTNLQKSNSAYTKHSLKSPISSSPDRHKDTNEHYDSSETIRNNNVRNNMKYVSIEPKVEEKEAILYNNDPLQLSAPRPSTTPKERYDSNEIYTSVEYENEPNKTINDSLNITSSKSSNEESTLVYYSASSTLLQTNATEPRSSRSSSAKTIPTEQISISTSLYSTNSIESSNASISETKTSQSQVLSSLNSLSSDIVTTILPELNKTHKDGVSESSSARFTPHSSAITSSLSRTFSTINPGSQHGRVTGLSILTSSPNDITSTIFPEVNTTYSETRTGIFSQGSSSKVSPTITVSQTTPSSDISDTYTKADNKSGLENILDQVLDILDKLQELLNSLGRSSTTPSGINDTYTKADNTSGLENILDQLQDILDKLQELLNSLGRSSTTPSGINDTYTKADNTSGLGNILDQLLDILNKLQDLLNSLGRSSTTPSGIKHSYTTAKNQGSSASVSPNWSNTNPASTQSQFTDLSKLTSIPYAITSTVFPETNNTYPPKEAATISESKPTPSLDIGVFSTRKYEITSTILPTLDITYTNTRVRSSNEFSSSRPDTNSGLDDSLDQLLDILQKIRDILNALARDRTKNSSDIKITASWNSRKVSSDTTRASDISKMRSLSHEITTTLKSSSDFRNGGALNSTPQTSSDLSSFRSSTYVITSTEFPTFPNSSNSDNRFGSPNTFTTPRSGACCIPEDMLAHLQKILDKLDEILNGMRFDRTTIPSHINNKFTSAKDQGSSATSSNSPCCVSEELLAKLLALMLLVVEKLTDPFNCCRCDRTTNQLKPRFLSHENATPFIAELNNRFIVISLKSSSGSVSPRAVATSSNKFSSSCSGDCCVSEDFLAPTLQILDQLNDLVNSLRRDGITLVSDITNRYISTKNQGSSATSTSYMIESSSSLSYSSPTNVKKGATKKHSYTFSPTMSVAPIHSNDTSDRKDDSDESNKVIKPPYSIDFSDWKDGSDEWNKTAKPRHLIDKSHWKDSSIDFFFKRAIPHLSRNNLKKSTQKYRSTTVGKSNKI